MAEDRRTIPEIAVESTDVDTTDLLVKRNSVTGADEKLPISVFLSSLFQSGAFTPADNSIGGLIVLEDDGGGNPRIPASVDLNIDSGINEGQVPTNRTMVKGGVDVSTIWGVDYAFGTTYGESDAPIFDVGLLGDIGQDFQSYVISPNYAWDTTGEGIFLESDISSETSQLYLYFVDDITFESEAAIRLYAAEVIELAAGDYIDFSDSYGHNLKQFTSNPHTGPISFNTIDFNWSRNRELVLDADVGITAFSEVEDPNSTTAFSELVLMVVQDAVGGHNITAWPSDVSWDDGMPPDFSNMGPNTRRPVFFVWDGAGDTYHGHCPMSSAEVKASYESNADTNAYDDAAKTKVDLITVTNPIDLDDLFASNSIVVQQNTFNGFYDDTMSSGVAYTIGKTGSGADFIWDDLDEYPDNCLVDITLYAEIGGDGASSDQNVEFYFSDYAMNTSRSWVSATSDSWTSAGSILAVMTDGLINFLWVGAGITMEGINMGTNYAINLSGGASGDITGYGYPDYTTDTELDISSETQNTTQSVGPTGSGADIIWPALDSLPDNVIAIEISAIVDYTPSGAGTLDVTVLAVPSEVSTPSYSYDKNYLARMVINPTVAGTKYTTRGTKTIPIGRDKIFNLRWYIDSLGTIDAANLDLVSWLFSENAGPTSTATIENGFENRTDSVISFVDGTRTFSIAPASTSFEFTSNEDVYVKSVQEDVVITDQNGLHAIYYNNGVLTAEYAPSSEDFENIILKNHAFVAMIYWSTTDSEAVIISDERHGRVMDSRTHVYLHRTQGTAYDSGLALANIVADGSGDVDTHAQAGYVAGVIWDEDIKLAIDAQAGGNSIPIMYRDGATNWRKTDSTFIVKTTGTGRAAYNLNSGGSFSQAEVTNNDFVLSHFFATGDINNPVIIVQGQNEYSSVADARAGALTELSSIAYGELSALTPEFKAIATVILQTSDSYTNTVQSRVRSTDTGDDYVDWRGNTALSSGGVAAGNHNDLSGIQGGDTGDYQHLTTQQATSATIYKSGTISAESSLNSRLCRISFLDNTYLAVAIDLSVISESRYGFLTEDYGKFTIYASRDSESNGSAIKCQILASGMDGASRNVVGPDMLTTFNTVVDASEAYIDIYAHSVNGLNAGISFKPEVIRQEQGNPSADLDVTFYNGEAGQSKSTITSSGDWDAVSKPASVPDQYITDTLSYTNFGKISSVVLTAQGQMAHLRLLVYDTETLPSYAEFNIQIKQSAAMGSDPSVSIRYVRGSSYKLGIDIPSLVSFNSSVTASSTVIDFYMKRGASGNTGENRIKVVSAMSDGEVPVFYNDFPVDTEANITGGAGWDATSQADFGTIVYDDDLTLNGDFGSQTSRLTVTRGEGCYHCDLRSPILTYSSSTSANSSSGAIPSDYRPDENADNMTYASSSLVIKKRVASDGTVTFFSNNWSGTATNSTSTGARSHVSWTIDD